MSTLVLSQPMLFPWQGMFAQLRLADTYVIYDDVQFSKGSFTNRVQLKTLAGPAWMTIPLVRGPLGQLISDVIIDDSQPWRERHRNAVQSAYANAPYVDDALRVMDEAYACASPHLADVLLAGLQATCRYLGPDFPPPDRRSSSLAIGGSATPRVLNIVRQFNADRYITGHGARNYLEHERFEEAAIRVEYMDYTIREYPQVHGPFTPYVSILDLIAHQGAAAERYIEPRSVYWKDFLAAEGEAVHRK